MKAILCILGVLVTAICINCQISPQLQQVAKDCHKETGLSMEMPKGALNDMDDPKRKCFFACLMTKMGSMKNGKVLGEKEGQLFTKSKLNMDSSSIQEKLTECRTKANEETDECEVAGVMQKCIMEKFEPFLERSK